MKIGVSKQMPSPRISLIAVDRYSLIVMTALKFFPTPDEESDDERKRLVIRERAAGQEEEDPREDEGPDVPPLAAVERGGDEEPDLPEQDRRREDHPGEQRDAEIHQEGLGQRRVGEVLARRENTAERTREEVEDLLRPGPAQTRKATKTAIRQTMRRFRNSSRWSKNPIRGRSSSPSSRRPGASSVNRAAPEEMEEAAAKAPRRPSRSDSSGMDGSRVGDRRRRVRDGDRGRVRGQRGHRFRRGRRDQAVVNRGDVVLDGRDLRLTLLDLVSIVFFSSSDALLNSASPFPRDLPISGSFFGPKTRRATTKIRINSGIPMEPNMFPPAQAILTPRPAPRESLGIYESACQNADLPKLGGRRFE